MKWVLIIAWSSYYGHGGVTMQEFDTLRACQWASTQVVQIKASDGNGGARLNMRCVPKGDGQ